MNRDFGKACLSFGVCARVYVHVCMFACVWKKDHQLNRDVGKSSLSRVCER